MLRRASRLFRRSVDVYQESGSWAKAAGYLGTSVTAKASTLAKHLLALRQVALPWRARAEATRITTLREGGRLAVAITVTGGLGDQIVIARFLRDLAAEVEPFSFDIFVSTPGVARWVFASVPGFGTVQVDTLGELVGRSYDLRLSLHQAIVVHYEHANWAALRSTPKWAELIARVTKARRRGLDPYIMHHPRLDNGLARKAVYANRSRRDFLHGLAGIRFSDDLLEIASEPTVAARFGLEGRRYVTIHNGFDTNFVIAGQRATKCYPHFAAVVAQLKAAMPDVTVVQIGTTTSEPIPGVDLDLIGKTNLREVAGLLRNVALHIDNEGGLVHLAACYGRRSLVVFGPTPSDYFGYPSNVNVDPLRCGGCWWIDELWMDRCPRGLEQPECVYAQPPERVAALALEALGADDPRDEARQAMVAEDAT